MPFTPPPDYAPHPSGTIAVLAFVLLLAGAVWGLRITFTDDTPHEREDHAVLCDYVCLTPEEGTQTKCEWYCEDPEIAVSCNRCEYMIESGRAEFKCRDCDVGTY